MSACPRQQELTWEETPTALGPAHKRGLTILHVVPLDEVMAQVPLAHLLNVTHAYIKQVVLEVVQRLPQALPLQ